MGDLPLLDGHSKMANIIINQKTLTWTKHVWGWECQPRWQFVSPTDFWCLRARCSQDTVDPKMESICCFCIHGDDSCCDYDSIILPIQLSCLQNTGSHREPRPYFPALCVLAPICHMELFGIPTASRSSLLAETHEFLHTCIYIYIYTYPASFWSHQISWSMLSQNESKASPDKSQVSFIISAVLLSPELPSKSLWLGALVVPWLIDPAAEKPVA